MKLNFFTKPQSVDREKLQQQYVEQKIENFKQNPNTWDESKLGDKDTIGRHIRTRLIKSMSKPSYFSLNYKRVVSIAASIVLVGTLVWFAFKNQKGAQEATPMSAMLTMVTGKNQIKKFKLNDGTVVWLNENSTLRYPRYFNGKKREVVLAEGEAYFDVYHDKNKPFQVRAGKTLTNVLGTSFNISSYPWRSTINVTVSSGKVAVNDQILLPNDHLSYHKSSNYFEKKRLQNRYVPSWIDRKLAFDDEDLKTIAAILERRFNVNISFDTKDETLEKQRFTAAFEQQDQLKNILDMLAITGDFSYQIKENNVILNK